VAGVVGADACVVGAAGAGAGVVVAGVLGVAGAGAAGVAGAGDVTAAVRGGWRESMESAGLPIK
jgi:hypothetical protein